MYTRVQRYALEYKHATCKACKAWFTNTSVQVVIDE
jgi:hypothetical protein